MNFKLNQKMSFKHNVTDGGDLFQIYVMQFVIENPFWKCTYFFKDLDYILFMYPWNN